MLNYVAFPIRSSVYLYLEVTPGSVNIENNQTLITISAWLRCSNGQTYNGSASNSVSVQVDGVTALTASNVGYDFRSASTVSLGSTSRHITHNSDGSKTINCLAQFNDGDNFLGTTSVSMSLPLSALPRSTQVMTLESFGTADERVYFTLAKKLDSYRHYAALFVEGVFIGDEDGRSNSAAGINSNGRVSLSLDAVRISRILGATKNTRQAGATVTVTTYTSGGAVIGTSTIGGTCHISGMHASNLTAVKVNAITVASTLIPTAEALPFAVAYKGALTFESTYKIADGAALGSITHTGSGINAQDVKAITPTEAGDITVTSRLVDSRGFTSAISSTIAVAAYNAPLLDVKQCARKATVQNKLELILDTLTAPVLYADKVTNAYSLKVEIAPMGGTFTTCYDVTALASNLSGETTITPTNVIDVTKTYKVKISLADRFETVTVEREVGTEAVPFAISREGIGVGRIPEDGYALDVLGKVRFMQSPEILGATDNPRLVQSKELSTAPTLGVVSYAPSLFGVASFDELTAFTVQPHYSEGRGLGVIATVQVAPTVLNIYFRRGQELMTDYITFYITYMKK